MPKDDGVHNYFFGGLPEMPWKQKPPTTPEYLREIADKIESGEYLEVMGKSTIEQIDDLANNKSTIKVILILQKRIDNG